MKVRISVTVVAMLLCLWSIIVLLSGKIFLDRAFIIAKEDAISLMLAQCLLVPCVLWLALNRRTEKQ